MAKFSGTIPKPIKEEIENRNKSLASNKIKLVTKNLSTMIYTMEYASDSIWGRVDPSKR